MVILILSMNKYLGQKSQAKLMLWWKLDCYSPRKIICECEPLRTKEVSCYKVQENISTIKSQSFQCTLQDFKFCYRYWFMLLFTHIHYIDSHTELLWHSHAATKHEASLAPESLLWNDCRTGISEARFLAEKKMLTVYTIRVRALRTGSTMDCYT